MAHRYMFNGKRCEIAETIYQWIPGTMINDNRFRLRYDDGSEQTVSVHDFRGSQRLNSADDLTKFEALLQHPEFSHISHRRNVGQNVLHVYRRDRESPSGCILLGGAMDDDAARAILAKYGKSAQQAGLMGDMAASQGMRGF